MQSEHYSDGSLVARQCSPASRHCYGNGTKPMHPTTHNSQAITELKHTIGPRANMVKNSRAQGTGVQWLYLNSCFMQASHVQGSNKFNNRTGDHQSAYFMCFCCLLPSMCYKLPTVACIHAMCQSCLNALHWKTNTNSLEKIEKTNNNLGKAKKPWENQQEQNKQTKIKPILRDSWLDPPLSSRLPQNCCFFFLVFPRFFGFS